MGFDGRMPRRRSARLAAPRHWIAVSISLFVLVISLGFATRYMAGLTTPQLAIDRAINSTATGTGTGVALILDKLDQPVVIGLILLVFFLIIGLRSSWLRALGFCIVTGAGWLTCLVVKDLVRQPRPVDVGLSHPIHVAAATLSYPSGHVTFVVALGVALIALARHRGAKVVVGIVMFVVALVVGASRLYLGLHYPSDIFGAILCGIAGTILSIGLWNLVIRGVQKMRRPVASRRRTAA